MQMHSLSSLADLAEALDGTWLMSEVYECHPAGSNYVCDPPVTDTDIDYVVLFHTGTKAFKIQRHFDLGAIEAELIRNGWECNHTYAQEHREALFVTARKGKLNLICYTDPIGYGRFVGGTQVCKKLNLLNKEDRVEVLRAATEPYYFATKELFDV